MQQFSSKRMSGNKSKGLIYGFITVFYIFALYVSIPFVRQLQKTISSTIGRAFFAYFVIIFFLVLLVFGIRFRRNSGRGRVGYFWLLAIFGIYLYLTVELWKAPEEAIHFVQYGILGILIFKTLSEYIGDITIYLTGAAAVFIVGVGDELIQWITPERYWDFRDVGLNFIGGALMLTAIWLGVKPKRISERISRKSVLIFSCFFSAAILILGLCMSLTPSVVKKVSEKMAMLVFVKNYETMMPEYGKRHVDPEIGIFFSKFSLEDLRHFDDQVSRRLLTPGNEDGLNPAEKMFLGEAREHLAERNRLFREVDQTGDTAPSSRRAEFANRENRILEKYFGKTLTGLGEPWSTEIVRDIQEKKQTDGIYASPVTEDYFTAFSLKQVWAGILIILGLVWASNIYVHVRKGRLGAASQPVESL